MPERLVHQFFRTENNTLGNGGENRTMGLGKEIFRSKPTGDQRILIAAIAIVLVALIALTVFFIVPEFTDPRNGKLIHRLFVPGVIYGGGLLIIAMLIGAIKDTRQGQVIFYRNGFELLKPDGVYEYPYEDLSFVQLHRKDPDKDRASIGLGLALLSGNAGRAGMALAHLKQHLGVTFEVEGESRRSVAIPDFRSYVTLDERLAANCKGYARVTG